MRLFVSVDLPDDLAEPLAAVQSELGDSPGLKPTDPTQAHLTLKFLGDVDEAQVPDLEEALETAVDAAGVEPFTATFGGLGVFPSLDYISVVWVGVREGGDEFTRLHEAVERETTALGFEPEDHEFTPHVTLARLSDARPKERVQRVVGEQDPTVGEMRVREVRLTESTLDREGSTYSTVSRVAL
jgi:2'-5' RNA ligase